MSEWDFFSRGKPPRLHYLYCESCEYLGRGETTVATRCPDCGKPLFFVCQGWFPIRSLRQWKKATPRKDWKEISQLIPLLTLISKLDGKPSWIQEHLKN